MLNEIHYCYVCNCVIVVLYVDVGVPHDDPNTIYFHAPNDTTGKWHPLHDIAAKVYMHPINRFEMPKSFIN